MTLLADLALLLWIPWSAVLFLSLRRPLPAACLAILGASLFLPKVWGFDLPFGLSLDASRTGVLCAFAGVALLHGRELRLRRGDPAFLVLPAVLVVGSMVTAYTNRDPLQYGPLALPALTNHDVIAIGLQQAVDYGLPFFLGLCLFRRARDLRFVMQCLLAAGLLYSVFIVVELRLSPQFHRWVYGYHQHQFLQTVREGGFRPMVFMRHGLALAGFLLASCIAAWSLWNARLRASWLPGLSGAGRGGGPSVLPFAAYLSALLVACKSLAATVYGVFVLPLCALASARTQVRAAAVLAAFVALYPALRAADLVPFDTLLGVAREISAERAASLRFRLDNEQLLLEKAQERLLFGWGTWGRNRVYSTDTGEDLSVTDGAWIIDLGTFGLVGFATKFGLLVAPILAAQRRLKHVRSPQSRALLGGVALIVAVAAVDLLPNGFLDPFTLFLCGGLAGLTRGLVVEERLARRREAGQERAAAVPDHEAAPPRHSPEQPEGRIAAGLLTRRRADPGVGT